MLNDRQQTVFEGSTVTAANDWLAILRQPPAVATVVPEHEQKTTHSYVVNYPAHEERESDPHYKDFHHFRETTKATAQCAVGAHRYDFSECHGPLELHHAYVEFSLQNGIDLAWLEKDFPGISDPDSVGAWVESAYNLLWLCEWHHRGHGGAHCATHSDYIAEEYVRGLIL